MGHRPRKHRADSGGIASGALAGAEIATDCPTVRAALRHSPARIATYSNPLNAPVVICPNTARLNQLHAGICHGMAW